MLASSCGHCTRARLAALSIRTTTKTRPKLWNKQPALRRVTFHKELKSYVFVCVFFLLKVCKSCVRAKNASSCTWYSNSCLSAVAMDSPAVAAPSEADRTNCSWPQQAAAASGRPVPRAYKSSSHWAIVLVLEVKLDLIGCRGVCCQITENPQITISLLWSRFNKYNRTGKCTPQWIHSPVQWLELLSPIWMSEYLNYFRWTAVVPVATTWPNRFISTRLC